jgi:hypothetical protein
MSEGPAPMTAAWTDSGSARRARAHLPEVISR